MCARATVTRVTRVQLRRPSTPFSWRTLHGPKNPSATPQNFMDSRSTSLTQRHPLSRRLPCCGAAWGNWVLVVSVLSPFVVKRMSKKFVVKRVPKIGKGTPKLQDALTTSTELTLTAPQQIQKSKTTSSSTKCSHSKLRLSCYTPEPKPSTHFLIFPLPLHCPPPPPLPPKPKEK